MKTAFTTAAVLVATTFAASAMTSDALVKGEIAAMGFDAGIVDTLSAEQVAQLSRALNNGEDKEARGEVASLLNKFNG